MDYNLYDMFTGGRSESVQLLNTFNMVQQETVGHDSGGIAQQRANLSGRSARLVDDGRRKHIEIGGPADAGACGLGPESTCSQELADVAGEPADSSLRRREASPSVGTE